MEDKIALKNQLTNLVHLQVIDIQIDEIKKKQNILPLHLKEMQKKMKGLKSQIEILSEEITQKEKLTHQLQSALTMNADRQERSQSKLTAVSNLEQYQAAQKEIEQLKKLTGSLSEQEKESQAGIDTLIQKKKHLEEEFELLSLSFQEEYTLIHGQSDAFQNTINELIHQRSSFLIGLEPHILSQYTKIRSARAGIAIVPIVSGQCKGCNMIVPAQMFIEIMKAAKIYSCPNCRRLLFLEEKESAKH